MLKLSMVILFLGGGGACLQTPLVGRHLWFTQDWHLLFLIICLGGIFAGSVSFLYLCCQ